MHRRRPGDRDGDGGRLVADPIRKVAVLGAGTMGAGIAAQVANGGVPVLLLDIVPDGANDRSVLAKKAIANLAKAKPAAFMHQRAARLITPGNLEDDLGKLAEVDWIVEAVLEDRAVKEAVYEKIEAARREGSVVSSNTSTIPLADLTANLPARFARDFVITHFFNPPRYMRLLELVRGPETRTEAADAVRDFADRVMGKTVVDCHDRPGFIANRVGVMWLLAGVIEAVDGGLTVEEADAVGGRPMGIPPTGVFGLLDLVGIDVMPLVLGSLESNLAKDDPFFTVYRPLAVIDKLVAAGNIGRKSGAGFYRRRKEGGKTIREALDLATGDYRASQPARLDSLAAARGGLKALVAHADKGGRYARRV
ncbi:MAG: 3-hydroxyacyl-CoA dehydrogenase family protein, partial [Alphaproteobacteria bacterium]|nr:3-hydroxyacyl-CoA dehydrogenase family protein [Alphaproteobacteria bacterium]